MANKRSEAISSQIRALQAKKKMIDDANERFKSMSAAEKRVAVAKDVLAQLKADTYKAVQGTYVSTSGREPLFSLEPGETTELIEVLDDMPTCQVCARGAMLLSSVRMFNNFPITNIVDHARRPRCIGPGEFYEYEARFFPPKMVETIESMFEASSSCDFVSHNGKDDYGLGAYVQDFPGTEDRLVEIMKNIIRNKGNFVIPNKYVREGRKVEKELSY